jgi:hypothetical protein
MVVSSARTLRSFAPLPYGEVRAMRSRPGKIHGRDRRPTVRPARLLKAWDRFGDDRTLVRLKLMILAALLVMTALLERVV